MRLQFYKISAIIVQNSASQWRSEDLNFREERTSDRPILFNHQQLKGTNYCIANTVKTSYQTWSINITANASNFFPEKEKKNTA